MPLTKIRLNQLIMEKVEFIRYLKQETDITYRSCLIGVNNIQVKVLVELYVNNFKISNKEKNKLEKIINDCENTTKIYRE